MGEQAISADTCSIVQESAKKKKSKVKEGEGYRL